MKNKKFNIKFGPNYYINYEVENWDAEYKSYSDFTGEDNFPDEDINGQSIKNEMCTIAAFVEEMAIKGVDISDKKIVKSIDNAIQRYYSQKWVLDESIPNSWQDEGVNNEQ